MAKLGRIMPRDREAVSGIEMFDAKHMLVMHGDPGIHQSSQELFWKKMDCRVKPGNDGVS
jgi:hypothetical protein